MQHKLKEKSQQQALVQLELAALQEQMVSLKREADRAKVAAQKAQEQLALQQAAEGLTAADWQTMVGQAKQQHQPDSEGESARTTRNKQARPQAGRSSKSDSSWSLAGGSRKGLTRDQIRSVAGTSKASSQKSKAQRVAMQRSILVYCSNHSDPSVAGPAKAAKSILETFLLVWDLRNNRPDKEAPDVKRLKGEDGQPDSALKKCVTRRIVGANGAMTEAALHLTQAKLISTDGQQLQVKIEKPIELAKPGDLGKYILKKLREWHGYLVAERDLPQERGKPLVKVTADQLSEHQQEQFRTHNELLRLGRKKHPLPPRKLASEACGCSQRKSFCRLPQR